MQPGAQIGAYRLVEQIGAGGMGAVWEAVHDTLGRRAAIKFLHAEHSARPDIVHRFFNEARAATAIRDPGIVQVFDVGYADDGATYIIMELLDGEGLDRRLARLRRLDVPDALRVVRQVAATLGAAHAVGIVHRDIKPENIFLVRDPEVPGGERAKVLDFGIAKLVDDKARVTSSYSVIGTPTYMSPEQCRGAAQVDARSDVYSLGCVLYTLLVGRPPFKAVNTGEMIAAHLQEPAPMASARAREVPPAVDTLIATCLAKAPEQRYGSGSELAAAIAELLANPELLVPGDPTSVTVVDVPAAARESAPRWMANTVGVAGEPSRPSVSDIAMPTGTTLSGATGQMRMQVAPEPAQVTVRSRSRLPAILGLSAAAITGIVVALVLTPGLSGPRTSGSGQKSAGAPPPPTTAAAVAPPPTAVTAAAVAPPPAAVTPADVTTHHIAGLLAAFSAWAPAHRDAACPTLADLGDPADAVDGWGNAMTVTCTDQPGDQIVGVRSAGPDGVPGSADDVTSWLLGRDVVAVVAGPRWVPSPKPRPVARPAATRPATPKRTGFEVDDNGIPISRRPEERQ